MLSYEFCCSELAFANSLSLENKVENIALRSVFEKCCLSVSKISTNLPKAAAYAQRAENA